MQLIFWKSPNGFSTPMVKDETMNRWTVGRVAASTYGVTEDAVNNMFQTHREDLGLKPSPPRVKEFFRLNKTVFGIQRVRRILSEDDVLMLGMLLRTPEARVARREFLEFIKRDMLDGYPSMAQFQEVIAQLEEVQKQLAALKTGAPYVQKAASAAGSALVAHRHTKHLRLVK